MTKPFTPRDAVAAHAETIPDLVIDVVNGLLAEESRGTSRRITFTSKEVSKRIKALLPDHVKFEDRWLDFEGVYRRYGWKVSYDGPGYNESYDGFYIFEKKDED